MQSYLIIAVLPVILLCLYIYKKDVDKEPKVLLRKVFVGGMISIIPILILELAVDKVISTDNIDNLINLFVATFVGVALIEEGAKWFVTWKVVYNNKDFDHPYDAIVYAVFASLGFAVVENIFYVIANGISTGILRAVLTVPSHACDAIIMGYYLGRAKQEEFNGNIKKANLNMSLSLIAPAVTHAIYDYLIFSQRGVLIAIFFIFVIIVYIVCFKLVKRISGMLFNFDGTRADKKGENAQPNRFVTGSSTFYHAIGSTLAFTAVLVVVAVILNLL